MKDIFLSIILLIFCNSLYSQEIKITPVSSFIQEETKQVLGTTQMMQLKAIKHKNIGLGFAGGAVLAQLFKEFRINGLTDYNEIKDAQKIANHISIGMGILSVAFLVSGLNIEAKAIHLGNTSMHLDLNKNGLSLALKF